MNRKPQGLEASKAVVGFRQYKGAEGLAPITVSGYDRDLKLWIDHMGDIDVVKITSQHILSFLNYIRTDYNPAALPVITPKNSLRKPYTTFTSAWHPF